MRRFLPFALLLSLLTAAPALAQLEIRGPGQQTISLALPTFLSGPGQPPPALAAEFNETLAGLLDLSGLFSLVDPASFLSDARKPVLTSAGIDFD